MSKTETILLAIMTLSIGITIGIVTLVFASDTALRNRDAIICINRYLQTQDKTYQSFITSCKAEKKEEKKRVMRLIEK